MCKATPQYNMHIVMQILHFLCSLNLFLTVFAGTNYSLKTQHVVHNSNMILSSGQIEHAQSFYFFPWKNYKITSTQHITNNAEMFTMYLVDHKFLETKARTNSAYQDQNIP